MQLARQRVGDDAILYRLGQALDALGHVVQCFQPVLVHRNREVRGQGVGHDPVTEVVQFQWLPIAQLHEVAWVLAQIFRDGPDGVEVVR